MSIVKELNDLAEKMTGTNPNKKTIAKVLDYIEQNYTADGGSGSGGSSAESDIFVVKGSTSDGAKYTIDKTFQELVGAYTEGKSIIYTDEMGSTFLNVIVSPGGATTFNGFLTMIDSLNVMNVKSITISNTEVNVQFDAYTLTPSN